MTATQTDLAKYDFRVLIDKSGSMSTTDGHGGKSRWQDAQEATMALAQKCAEFDSDGIDVIVFANTIKVYEGVTPDKVAQVFAENEPNGGTDTAQALQKALDMGFSKEPFKPSINVVITDGQPNDKQAVRNTIINATKKIKSDDDLGFLFMQVGQDASAHSFLKELDDGLEAEGAAFDVVSALTMDEIENRTLAEALLAAINE